ncbi:putative kinetoplast-associated protein KAP [Rosellinia necatrix]|uniref:Putative kinetoplast-associated protein KAP n=1 Tax=Rosellinia necatrix TaxID=77044 RepID=A0A1W2TW17_ROSNE|nr:putative kinetoplast-associated protein KAP [Rosellinia necatrix]
MASAPATPLSSTDGAVLNAVAIPTPTPTMRRLFDAPADRLDDMENHATRSAPSLEPAQNHEKDATQQDQENVSPNKARHSRILSGNGLSPLKILAAQDLPSGETRSPNKSPTTKSPRKWSPDKRFPIKVNTALSPEKPTMQPHETTLDDAIVENKGVAQAIDIFEDDDTTMGGADNGGTGDRDGGTGDRPEDNDGEDTFMSISQVQVPVEDEEHAGPDDTMISTFSTFSAVPNLTMFARIGHTPTKFATVDATPTSRRPEQSAQKMVRPADRRDSGNTTNLLDFTDQIQSFSSRYAEQMSNLRRGSPAKATMGTTSATPKKRQADLLDFDIPPLPTPRSIPTITPRELESLKSGFLSEISSLKASLSGKEAEVLSLKTAVADAEKRVGESLEELREVRAVKEGLAEQQQDWERRGRDMESVLRKVKEEIVRGQSERDQLESKFEESEKRREAAEIMAQEAESKMAAMRAGKANSDAAAIAAATTTTTTASDAPNNKSPGKKAPGSREVEIAVEKVSRELHSLYKSKHESKITALKKSYESRWSKKVHELEARLEGLADENERLRADRDATMTRVDPNQTLTLAAADDERKAQAVRDSTQIRELSAEVQKLAAVVTSVKADNQELRLLLERERVEKGELVQLAEEMMAMQTFAQNNTTTQAPLPPPTPAAARPPPPPPAAGDNFRASVGRGSGLRAPGSVKKPTESRIGGLGSERRVGGSGGGSGGGALPRPGSGGRSGIMSSIEKMGNYRGGRGE